MSIRRRAGTLGTVVTQTGVTCHVSRDGDTAWSHPSAQWLRLDKKLDKKVVSCAVITLAPIRFDYDSLQTRHSNKIYDVGAGSVPSNGAVSAWS